MFSKNKSSSVFSKLLEKGEEEVEDEKEEERVTIRRELGEFTLSDSIESLQGSSYLVLSDSL